MSGKKRNMPKEEGTEDNRRAMVKRTIDACLSHASDLVRAAKGVLNEERLPNIAYHLAALALEEIGKADLIAMQHGYYFGDRAISWPLRHAEDHVKKLFWHFGHLHLQQK